MTQRPQPAGAGVEGLQSVAASAAPPWLEARAGERDALLERILSSLQADRRVAGAWLLGSLGRGTADAWSDIDLCVVVRDADVTAVLAERRDLVARPGGPLLVQDLPRNAPPGGAYLLVLYPGAGGPVHVDWYLRPCAGAVVPHEARLLFDRAGLLVAPAPGAPDSEERAAALLRDALFFWAMAPIAAKYIGRGRPGGAFDLLRAMAVALDRVRQTIVAPASEAVGEPWPGLLSADPRVQLGTLRGLCREMAQLLPRLEHLDGAGGRVTPELLPQLDRLLDGVQTLLPAGSVAPTRPKAAPQLAPES